MPTLSCLFKYTTLFTVIVYIKHMARIKQPIDPDGKFSIDDLCKLSALPVRTVRYYIQMGVLDKPLGEKRGAHYVQRHVEQLLRIRALSEAGVSLEAIKGVLRGDAPPVASKPAAPGTVVVRSHVLLGPGIELSISPAEASLTPEQLRDLISAMTDVYKSIKE